MSEHTRLLGTFVDCSNQTVSMEGELVLGDDQPVLELRDLNRLYGSLSHGRVFNIEKVVGYRGGESYILATDLRLRRVTHHTAMQHNVAEFVVYGDLVMTTDPEVFEKERVLVDRLHVRIDRLEEWVSKPLVAEASDGYPRNWFTMGYAGVLNSSPSTITLSRPPEHVHLSSDGRTEIQIGKDLSLAFENRLQYGLGDTRFSVTAFQDAVLVVKASEPCPIRTLVDAAETFRQFLRFVFNEPCHIRSMRGTCSGRIYQEESIFPGKPIPHSYGMYRRFKKEDLPGLAKPLFALEQTREGAVIAEWYKLGRYYRARLDELVGSPLLVYCQTVAVSYLGELANTAKPAYPTTKKKSPNKFENLLHEWGLHDWGVDAKKLGQDLHHLRDQPAHGKSYDEARWPGIQAAGRAVVSLMKLGVLIELGFTDNERKEIAVNQRWFEQ